MTIVEGVELSISPSHYRSDVLSLHYTLDKAYEGVGVLGGLNVGGAEAVTNLAIVGGVSHIWRDAKDLTQVLVSCCHEVWSNRME